MADYNKTMHIRIIGRTTFDIVDSEVIDNIDFTLDMDKEFRSSYNKEKRELSKKYNNIGEDISELVHNLMYAEATKYVEELKQLQEKYKKYL